MKRKKQIEIATKLGISHSAVSQWFSGSTKPTADRMFQLEDEFGIPLSAWRDIKSYIKNNTPQPTKSTTTKG